MNSKLISILCLLTISKVDPASIPLRNTFLWIFHRTFRNKLWVLSRRHQIPKLLTFWSPFVCVFLLQVLQGEFEADVLCCVLFVLCCIPLCCLVLCRVVACRIVLCCDCVVFWLMFSYLFCASFLNTILGSKSWFLLQNDTFLILIIKNRKLQKLLKIIILKIK